jgi:Flp pilus assembly protein TadG
MKFLARFYMLCKIDTGQALVELALMLPVLLVLVFGAIDLGRAYSLYVQVVNAAHAGAAFGSRNPTDTAGIAAAAQNAEPGLTLAGAPAVTAGRECSDGSLFRANGTSAPTCSAALGGNTVSKVVVTTSSIYTPLVPWPGIASSYTMSTSASMRGN